MRTRTYYAFALVAITVELIVNGYTLAVLWSWFVATKFGLPVLSIPEALGLVVVVSYLTTWKTRDTKDDEDGLWIVFAVLMTLVKAGTCLGLGWVILQFT